ncbi:hypothetical protein SAMN05444000_1021, partial [Shimia gijangensis]
MKKTDDDPTKRIWKRENLDVLSDKFELVSTRTKLLPFMPCRDRATQQEQR